MSTSTKEFDVIVAGGGQAGLISAIVAAEAGASVCLLEGAPKSYRGGNTRHTRNLRPMHNGPLSVLSGVYDEEEYWDDLLRVTKGKTNESMARMMLRESASCVDWLEQRGVQFQPPLGGTLHLGRTNAFFMGGGKQLINALYRFAEKLGIRILYEAKVTDIKFEAGRFEGAYIGKEYIQGRAFVAAAGGFEANIEWLREAWGPVAENFIIRGTPYNRGELLKLLLDKGAKQIGEPDQCHAVAIDGRAPKFDGGICTRVDCVSLGIVVNKEAKRFYDEGEDFWPKRYAIWGRLVAKQPDQIGHVIIDAKSKGAFMPPVFPAETADTIEELALKIGLDPQTLKYTVDTFNAAVQPGTFDHTELDGLATSGLEVNKTNWARPIDTPPYNAYSLKPGITFTYLGVGVNQQAKMLMRDETPSENIFAAGEIMAGNVLGEGYLAGIGMTIGNVFGQIAGREAAKYALNK
ncbi:FAD-dependent tricarballylate dehydrogenase TcuA [Marinobacterium sp. LSUCC0821]|uniref:FAD-dependent tricarballylate dehydrogenase TcuA n=1 Tax=Marinobacterium sp. LSUCC0821 TaxID=2668067 RepID=UPI001452950E|nr:FAD-dependent tricarballylate dehydrogenase TcuA [Marinobacterium sp. LSUCC0821]QJD72075.1 FAD-dependent tricarballylate dehydrogenase TcuA [Marinobacterium sp. LSUCC0821]